MAWQAAWGVLCQSAIDSILSRRGHHVCHSLAHSGLPPRLVLAHLRRHTNIIKIVQSGRIVESGTHGDLLALRGQYAKSWQNQMRGAGDGE